MLSLGRRDSREDASSSPGHSASASASAGASASAPPVGNFELAGSLTRQNESDAPTPEGATSHIVNLGKLIEDMEGKIRNQIVEIYFGKTKDVLGMLRSKESLEVQRREAELRKELMGMWKR